MERFLPQLSGFEKIKIFSVAVLTLGVQWRFRNHTIEAAFLAFRPSLRVTILTAMLLLIIICPGENRAFIYFQF